jgi:hypothetical protein
MKKKLTIAGVIVLLAASMPTAADMFSPSHSCHKPYKPYKFEDQWAVDRFRQEVETYKRCISDFVDEQNEEAEKHREAAEEAIDEWNRYINYELR